MQCTILIEPLFQGAAPSCSGKAIALLFAFFGISFAVLPSLILCNRIEANIAVQSFAISRTPRWSALASSSFPPSGSWHLAVAAFALQPGSRTMASLPERVDVALQKLETEINAEASQSPFLVSLEASRRIDLAAREVEIILENSVLENKSAMSVDSSLLDGSWQLIFDSNGARTSSGLRRLLQSLSFGISEVIVPRLLELPQFQLSSLRQDIDIQGQRMKNFVSLSPWPNGLQLPGPFGDVLEQLQDASVTLALDYRLKVNSDSRVDIVPEKLERSLTRSSGQRFDGVAASIPTSTFLGQPSFPVPEPLRNLGTESFYTTCIGSDYRISRSFPAGKDLRIYRRREAADVTAAAANT